MGVVGHWCTQLGHRILCRSENPVGFVTVVSTMHHTWGKNNVLSSSIEAYIFSWVGTLFSDMERYLFSLKQMVHVGANNSLLLLFCEKLKCWTDCSFHPEQVPCADSCLHPASRMFCGFMLAEISFWDMFASGGAFNSGSVVVWETFASPDDAFHCRVQSIISWGSRTFRH
jgi:hypothetical protein